MVSTVSLAEVVRDRQIQTVAKGVRTGVLNIDTPEGGNTAGSQSVVQRGTGT
jgi:hypothetical protein